MHIYATIATNSNNFHACTSYGMIFKNSLSKHKFVTISCNSAVFKFCVGLGHYLTCSYVKKERSNRSDQRKRVSSCIIFYYI